MKTGLTLSAILLFNLSTATADLKKEHICRHPEQCRAGDIILVTKSRVAWYCDFNASIVPPTPNYYACKYIGYTRKKAKNPTE